MQPEALDAESWKLISGLLIRLYLFATSLVTFALSMLIAHGVVPSLVATRHLPAKVQRIRPVFYGIAAIAIVAVVFFVTNILNLIGVIYGIFPRWAI